MVADEAPAGADLVITTLSPCHRILRKRWT